METQGGIVHLVGAGPGDPDLLTVKARDLLSQGDVVVYDRLVSDGVLDLIPPGTARIFVGKATGNHHLPQDDINGLLVTLARRGHSVVRLKGGDPFTFGRGGEEALYLARHGVRFTVVPGVTAASAVGAELGIPMTHRGLAQGLCLVTGHAREDGALDLDWRRLADPGTTLAIYMGLSRLGALTAELMAAGLSADTPAAAVASGTTADQRQCVGTLAELPDLVARLEFEPPVLVVIGRVVALSGLLNWRGLVYEGDEDLVAAKRQEHA